MSPQFHERLATIVEQFQQMQSDLARERAAMNRTWAKREKQIETIVSSTAKFTGELQALYGSSLPKLPQLQLPGATVEVCSNLIFSVPSSAFILQPASDAVEDNRVVVTIAKNNNGEQLGERTAWERQNGDFTFGENFDWDEYDKGAWKPREAKVQAEHLRALFENGEL